MVLPEHIAVIMDGNGRWAQRRMLPRAAGHRAGMKRMLSLTEHIFGLGIPYCTLFALSAENLSRPKEELDELFELIRIYFTEQIGPLRRAGIALRVVGDCMLLPAATRKVIEEGVRAASDGAKGTLALAIGYGGRQDIVSAAEKLAEAGAQITLESFRESLSTGGMPAVDLLIRTGKEKRLSNFLLFESAYAELVFSDKLFPDFTCRDLDRALSEYAKRERRYGKIET